jgi:hypothetical protein
MDMISINMLIIEWVECQSPVPRIPAKHGKESKRVKKDWAGSEVSVKISSDDFA